MEVWSAGLIDKLTENQVRWWQKDKNKAWCVDRTSLQSALRRATYLRRCVKRRDAIIPLFQISRGTREFISGKSCGHQKLTSSSTTIDNASKFMMLRILCCCCRCMKVIPALYLKFYIHNFYVTEQEKSDRSDKEIYDPSINEWCE